MASEFYGLLLSLAHPRYSEVGKLDAYRNGRRRRRTAHPPGNNETYQELLTGP